MKKSIFLVCTALLLILISSCRKDKNTPPDDTGGDQTIPTDVQVVLPAGSTIDLSKTRIFTLGGVSNVNGDGKATVPFIQDNGQLVFLFDEADNIIMESYITSSNKEISVRTTAQALLFQGLRFILLPDSVKFDFLNKSATSEKLASYYSKMEQAFKADPLMVGNKSCLNIITETINQLRKTNPIDIHAKQIDIIDDDIQSYLQIVEADEENVNIRNTNYRRSHAFIYKTAFKNQQGNETVLLNAIDYDDAAERDLKVERVTYKANAFDMLAVARGFSPVNTGPINLPISSSETEATYKIRVVGPGEQVSASLTDAEKAKLEDLYYEYLAFDILAPIYLEVLGYRKLVSQINEDQLKPFADKVKIIAKNDPTVMDHLRKGATNWVVSSFSDAAVAANQSDQKLALHLTDIMQQGFSNESKTFPAPEIKPEYTTLLEKGLNLLEIYVFGTYEGPAIVAPHDYFNELEEFEVKAKDHTVKISPKTSDVMRFVNHTLTVTANPSLDPGETVEYEWRTPGTFGVLKNGSQEGTVFTTTTKTINYYGKLAPDENNYEKVFVTVYINSSNGRRKHGTDTARINVKKVKIVMKPVNPELNPIHGYKSIKLYLENSDGTNPITQGSAVQHRVIWSTAGAYGSFIGGNTTYITSTNNIVYEATDEDVKSATENIVAKV